MANGFEDVVHGFTEEGDFTQHQSPTQSAMRTDKIVMQVREQPTAIAPAFDASASAAAASDVKPTWKIKTVRIVGADARKVFAQKGEAAELIETDGVVRTPSHHMGIYAELTNEM